MYQLNYHSISISGLGIGDLENILEEAISTNSAKNISGCLIYHNKRFVQILEGSKRDVLQVYKNIMADKRHHSVTLLWENDIENRFFEEWNMAFYRPDDEDLKRFVNNLVLLAEFSDKSSGSLLSFWATVSKILRNGTISHLEKVYK